LEAKFAREKEEEVKRRRDALEQELEKQLHDLKGDDREIVIVSCTLQNRYFLSLTALMPQNVDFHHLQFADKEFSPPGMISQHASWNIYVRIGCLFTKSAYEQNPMNIKRVWMFSSF
jgi:hypothetical protein